MKIPKIPINLKALGKAGQIFVGQSSTETLVNILVDKTAPLYMMDACRDRLIPEPQSAEVNVVSFYDALPKLDPNATLTVILTGDSVHCTRLLEIASWSDHPLVALSTRINELINSFDATNAVDIAKNILEFPVTENPADIEYLERVDLVFEDLARWCSRKLPDSRISLGSSFSFMRQIIAFDLTKQTALENAVISAVFFLPGADLPVLTLNQAKLLYQIAVIYNIPLTSDRFKELAVIMLGAFGCRALVRRLLRKPSPVAWVIRGGVSYAATMGIGHLSYLFYSHGGDFAQLGKQMEQEGYLLKEEIQGLPARLLPAKGSSVQSKESD